jgi:23S rRNA pseudouridine1911/1915/1917 synthase
MLLLDALIHRFPQAKKQTLRRMVEEGRVSLNGRPAKSLKQAVGESDTLEIADKARPQPPSLDPLTLVHEDPDVLVIDKPPGLLTSTNEKEWRPTAIAIVRKYLAAADPEARAGVIHRLDRDASGLLVFSKNNDAYEDLKSQFFRHDVRRVYTAVVHRTPHPPQARIHNHLVEHKDGTVHVTRMESKGEEATTDYRLVASKDGLSLVEVTLQTGRKHQIRVHLAARGHPIVGDTVYGRPPHPPRLLLCATTLGFTHPRTGKPMTFQVPPPAEIEKLFPVTSSR